jgi:hypothetical protein
MKPRLIFPKIAWLAGALFFVLSASSLFFLAGCGSSRVGELAGVVQLAKSTNSEGILVFIPGTQYRALTDENGSFLITGLPSSEYAVVAQFEGFDEARETVQIQAGQRTTLGPIILQKPYKPQGSISGFITLEGETNHQDILLLLVGTTYTTSTNTTGYFQLTNIPTATYQLLALKDNWVPVSRNDIQVAEGQETQVPNIQLRKAEILPTPTLPAPSLGDFLLQGSAFLEGEENHAGIRVSLVEMPEKFAITDATGAFTLGGLDDKPHSLILSHAGFVNEKIADAIPVSATSASSCGFVTLQREYQPDLLGVLQGRVFLDGLKKYDNTTVQLQGISPPVFTDVEGRFKFVGIPSNKYVLIAEHPGFESGQIESVEIKANQVVQAPDLTLTPLKKEEQAGTGGIVGMAMLEGETDQGGIVAAIEGTTFTAVTGTDGQFVFDKVPIGAYTMIFTKSGFKNYYLGGVPVLLDQNTALEPVLLAKDVEPPYVLECFPRDGSRKIPINQFVDVIVRFSERMDAGSVKQAVTIDPPVGFDAFFDRESDLSDFDTLHIRLYHQPPDPLMFNTQYQVQITPQARTPKGIPMAEPFVFSFNTDGPLIVDSIPRKGEGQFLLNQGRKIMFLTNAPVDQTTFERAIRIRPQPDSKPAIEFIPMEMGTQITIEANWRANTRYRVQLDNAMRTVERQRFSNTPFSLNFRTEYTPESDQFQPGVGRSFPRRGRQR